MDMTFYISAAVAVLATVMVITRTQAVHALLYLIVSLMAVAVIFFVLGAPMVAALEVIIYAGAIMVLFVFVIMMLNLGPHAAREESAWLAVRTWIGPGLLTAILLAELVWILARPAAAAPAVEIGPHEFAVALFGPYVVGVELSSMLLMAGLVGAYHLGRRDTASTGGKGKK
jgi:NADH-quinone oxidoreductase subunit J